MDLRAVGDVPGGGALLLRNFRPVKDGTAFCWDLIFSDPLGDGEQALELPGWLDAFHEPAAAALAGAPAILVRQALDDRIFVSATSPVGAPPVDDAPPSPVQWLNNAGGWLRWVKLTSKDGAAELVWCVRVEGGPELATPIARAWGATAELTTRVAQLVMPGTTKAPPKKPEALPPEPDDEGREHDRDDDDDDRVVPLKPRTATRRNNRKE